VPVDCEVLSRTRGRQDVLILCRLCVWEWVRLHHLHQNPWFVGVGEENPDYPGSWSRVLKRVQSTFKARSKHVQSTFKACSSAAVRSTSLYMGWWIFKNLSHSIISATLIVKSLKFVKLEDDPGFLISTHGRSVGKRGNTLRMDIPCSLLPLIRSSFSWSSPAATIGSIDLIHLVLYSDW